MGFPVAPFQGTIWMGEGMVHIHSDHHVVRTRTALHARIHLEKKCAGVQLAEYLDRDRMARLALWRLILHQGVGSKLPGVVTGLRRVVG